MQPRPARRLSSGKPGTGLAVGARHIKNHPRRQVLPAEAALYRGPTPLPGLDRPCSMGDNGPGRAGIPPCLLQNAFPPARQKGLTAKAKYARGPFSLLPGGTGYSLFFAACAFYPMPWRPWTCRRFYRSPSKLSCSSSRAWRSSRRFFSRAWIFWWGSIKEPTEMSWFRAAMKYAIYLETSTS